MRVKLISGVSAIIMFSSFLLTSANALAQNSLYIYSPDTNTGTTVYFGPQTPVSTTTTATSTTVITTGTTTSVSVTPANCPAYLTTFHKYGDSGVDVSKLQVFLNQTNGSKLNGKGFYGPATMQEVKNLQYTYGIKVTGAQYEKTTGLINSLVCGNINKRVPLKAGASISGYMGTVTVGGGTVTVGKTKPTGIVYPNPNSPVVKEYVKNNPNGMMVKGADVMGTSTKMTSTTTNSFWDNLKADFQKIKDNYKAYVLVFVLVLALFWFLRKAATE